MGPDYHPKEIISLLSSVNFGMEDQLRLELERRQSSRREPAAGGAGRELAVSAFELAFTVRELVL